LSQYSYAKNYKANQTVSGEKLCKVLSYEKYAHEIEIEIEIETRLTTHPNNQANRLDPGKQVNSLDEQV